jgi:hypothetical protein
VEEDEHGKYLHKYLRKHMHNYLHKYLHKYAVVMFCDGLGSSGYVESNDWVTAKLCNTSAQCPGGRIEPDTGNTMVSAEKNPLYHAKHEYTLCGSNNVLCDAKTRNANTWLHIKHLSIKFRD